MSLKALLLSLALLVLPLSGDAAPKEFAPKLDGVVRISGINSWGHGCVVEGTLLTAAHIGIDHNPLTGELSFPHLAWSDLAGHEGRARTSAGDNARDVVILKVHGILGKGYPIAKIVPKPGDRVRIFGYSRGKKNPVELRVEETTVVAVSAGQLFYEKSPGPGSSGACVINEAGEVVAINVAAIEHENDQFIYIGVALWGPWNVLTYKPEVE